MPLPELAKRIVVLIEKGDAAKEKADQYYIAAGIHLKDMKARKPGGTTWVEYVNEKCGLGKSRAYELMAIADGRTTVGETRAAKAKSVKKSRSRKRPLRSGHSKPEKEAEEQEEAQAESSNARPSRENSNARPSRENSKSEEQSEHEEPSPKPMFLLRASQAFAYAAYDGPVDRRIVTAARHAAVAWKQLADKLERQIQ